MMRACLDCPRLIPNGTRDGRCDEHRRGKDRARGSSSQRGYDSRHQAERKAWALLVATGTVTCRRAPSGHCLEPLPTISPDEPWQLGHPDAQCPAPKGPEHRRCNAATAGR